MTAIVAHPTAHLVPWRLIVAEPGAHDPAVVLDACEALRNLGTPEDRSRAAIVQSEIVARAVAEINAEGRTAARSAAMCRRLSILALCVGLLALAALF